MASRQELLLAYYGDDFTGSTDALEFLTRAGVRTALFLAPPSPATLARYPGLQAVGVAGLTRSLPPAVMEAELRPAFAALRALGAPHVHYKVCSTFDSSPTIGSIGRAIDLGIEVFRGPFVPLLVGAPALGRHCVFGNLFARMGIGSPGAIHRLDRHPAMSRHPVTPADEADLRRHLAKQTSRRIGLFDILQVDLPPAEAGAALAAIVAGGAEIVLFDVLYARQLALLGGLIDAYASRGKPLFSVGSSGIEMALGAHWAASRRLRPIKKWAAPGRAEPLLAISGSCSPVTARQIAWAADHGFAEVRLETPALAAGAPSGPVLAAATAQVVGHLGRGTSVVLHANRGEGDPRTAAVAAAFGRRGWGRTEVGSLAGSLFGGALGTVARRALDQVRVRRLLLAGGDSSSYAARSLGLEAVEMLAPLAPGAPLCRAHAPGSPADGLEVNFKGGQVGGEDYFGAVARGQL
jgi:uncharacterized protein YgbK (DUF1537 family)